MTEHHYDVLIVGSGLMGAATARCLRDAHPHLTMGMVDGGPSLSPVPGQHLHDVEDPQVWSEYNEKISSGIQGFYAGTTPTEHVGETMVGVRPGMYHIDSFGDDATDMPSAALAWNVGGMGVHWTAATPSPYGQDVTPFIPAAEWADDLARAAELLRVNTDPYPATPAGQAVLKKLGDKFNPGAAPGRHVQPMPMAINDTASGRKERTSPSVIFDPIGNPDDDPNFTLWAGTLATNILHTDGRVEGVLVREVQTGREHTLRADQVIVCADAFRTPQLLFASNIRPPALGKYLNEHAFLAGRVLADPHRVGFDMNSLPVPTDDEPFSDCLWVPFSGPEQPFQVHVMNNVMVDEAHHPIAYGVGLEIYVPTELQESNRLEFSVSETDSSDMPRITCRFTYTDGDRHNFERAKQVQKEAAELIGSFDPERESALLPAGTSLHFTGTVRMGVENDGSSVCDTDGRVWEFDNLYVAGCGVLPTALSCNSTLTGMTTAVRAARAVTAAVAATASPRVAGACRSTSSPSPTE